MRLLCVWDLGIDERPTSSICACAEIPIVIIHTHWIHYFVCAISYLIRFFAFFCCCARCSAYNTQKHMAHVQSDKWRWGKKIDEKTISMFNSKQWYNKNCLFFSLLCVRISDNRLRQLWWKKTPKTKKAILFEVRFGREKTERQWDMRGRERQKWVRCELHIRWVKRC